MSLKHLDIVHDKFYTDNINLTSKVVTSTDKTEISHEISTTNTYHPISSETMSTLFWECCKGSL